MTRFRPSKWVLPAFFGAGLPLLAAAVYEASSHKMTDAIAGRAASALSADEATAWAKVESNGRDFVLQGTAPSQEAVDKAVAAVAGTFGVRTLSQNIQIVEPIKLVAPTVEPVTSTEAAPTLTGTWQEGVAKTLSVSVGGKTYKLGENPELTTLAGEWTLKTPALPEGSYDVLVETSDGKETLTAPAGKLVIDLPEPVKLPLPTVNPYFGNMAMPTFTGTWPEVDAKPLNRNLQVKVGETMYVLGSNNELKSDGTGNWSLTPSVPLLEGEIEVMPGVVDADGKWSKAEAPAKAVIDLTPPPAPEIVAPAAGAVWPFAITGKWAETAGAGLVAAVAGRTYMVNRGAALSSDGQGNFTFQPSAKLAPGSYDIDFTVNDAAGNVTTKKLAAAIVIPEPVAAKAPEPAPAPVAIVPAAKAVVDAVPANAVWPYAITGTWDEKPGHTLSASVQGRTYVLGRGAALTSDGAGKFTFSPSARFAPGKYDVVFATNDATAETKLTVAPAAIVIPEPPVAAAAPPPPAPPAPPAKLPSPTVINQLDLTGAPLVKGTWPNDKATELAVNLAGRNYVLGKDANLRTKDGSWTLLPGTALADGVYDVKVDIANAEGVLGTDETKDELTVAVTQPSAPTVMTMSGDVSPDHLSGTWDQTMAKTLKVTIPQINVTAELGAAASPLIADGDGKWRLNLPRALPVGNYNVVVETTDQYGRVQTDSTESEILVAEKGKAPAVVPVAPYDCVAAMNRIGNVFPIRFEYDLTDITKPFDLSVSQYAALLKDPRCTSLNIEVQGHADFRGTEIYNEDLSDRRAQIIVRMLTDAGVGAGRLSIRAFGETKPLDPALTDEARAKNRRVEITVKP